MLYRDRLLPLLATASPDLEEHFATAFSTSSALGRFVASLASMFCRGSRTSCWLKCIIAKAEFPGTDNHACCTVACQVQHQQQHHGVAAMAH
jgi:hypothetical protein